MEPINLQNLPLRTNVGEYYSACRDNVTFVLDMLDALRCETDMIGDAYASRFWAGISDAIRAYAVANLVE